MKGLLRGNDPEVPVWASYTDVAMNVLVILLFYLFMQATLNTVISAQMMRVREQQRRMREVVERTIPANLRDDVSMTEDGQLLRFRFADRVLFDSGQAVLKESGKEVLAVMGDAFKVQTGSFSRIQVEGHTDDRSINTAIFPSNWELSSARATSVVRFLVDHSSLDPRLLSSTGYSQYHPVDPSDRSAKGQERNRRIEVVIVYSLLDHARETATASTTTVPLVKNREASSEDLIQGQSH